ncbi:MAG: PEP-CTERM sorting domain-containing protein, partial [Lacipirellulaceae bacterium]
FRDRVQVNDTGYVASTGDVFSLSYDFGAGGAPSRWTGVETMRTFLFTAASVDGNTIEGDITEIAGSSVDYNIDRANDGQWTSFSAPNFYTATAADNGQTLYFGMEFLDGDNSDGDLFPRIDIINLSVVAGIPEPSSIVLLSLSAVGLLVRKR